MIIGREVGDALLTGVLLAAATCSSIVAWRLGWVPELGPPLWRWFYRPWSAWLWWRDWGHLDGWWRRPFLQGLMLSAAFGVVPVMMVLVDRRSRLQVGQDRDRDDRMGTVAEMLRAGHVYRRGDGVVLGADPARGWWRRRLLRDDGDGHVLIVGATRAGKGTNHVVPTLLGHRGSVLAFDPKRELAEITGRRRGDFGTVLIVDPTDRATAHYNPLVAVRGGDHANADCLRLAGLILPVNAQERDPYWQNSARDLLTGILLHVSSGEQRDLACVWRTAMDISRGHYPAGSRGLAKMVFDAHQQLADNTRGGIASQLGTHLSFLADKIVRETTSRSDFSAGDLMAASDPMTVFLSVPVNDGPRLRPLMRVILDSLFQALTADKARTADGRDKRHGLLTLIDEFPHLGRLDVIEDKMPIMAGFGLRLCLVCQSVGQITGSYGPHQSITDNCRTKVFMPGFGESTKTVAGWAGKASVVHHSRQRSLGSLRGQRSAGQSETLVDLLEPGMMLERGKKEVLILTDGCKPTWLGKRPYHRELEFRGTWDRPHRTTVVAPAPVVERADTETGEAAPPLTEEHREMVDGMEGLWRELPPAAQAALRARL